MRHCWRPEEDQDIIRLVALHGTEWGTIAAHMENRTAGRIAERWDNCLDPNLYKGAFTVEEDEIIIGHVKQHGPQNWPKVARLLEHRCAKQCRERWCNHLDPQVSNSMWTYQEDSLIFDHFERFGAKWSMISQSLPGRTDNAIKNRWNSSIAKRIQTDPNGLRTLMPESTRSRSRMELIPAMDDSKPRRRLVAVDVSRLSPWQVQVLQQMHLLPTTENQPTEVIVPFPTLDLPEGLPDPGDSCGLPILEEEYQTNQTGDLVTFPDDNTASPSPLTSESYEFQE
jgi:hypothetical protein